MRKRPESPSYVGKLFSEVFERRKGTDRNAWRIRGSGVTGMPHHATRTAAVLVACKALGIEVKFKSYGSPGNANSYKVGADFLDGRLSGETGNYWYGDRGVWVRGAEAALLIARFLGLTIRRAWYREHDVADSGLEDLKARLHTTGEHVARSPAGQSG